MFRRILNPLKEHSFFLFGARGTGKSTFLNAHCPPGSYWIDLLLDEPFTRYSRQPDLLIKDLKSLKIRPKLVVIDEVQKVPKLLDIVHAIIEKSKAEKDAIQFALTGSSARKLKRGTANLLAGRAFQYNLYPLTARELGDQFSLDTVLKFGSLPQIFSFQSLEEKAEYLRSYTQTYLKEEILQEQLVRNGIAFRQFQEVSAQENGKTINFSKLSRDLGVDPKTVESYFQILEDTLVGFFLPAFHQSTRKSVKLQPKFYLFDLGVKRALAGELLSEVFPKTPAFGDAFEHFMVCEILRLNSYLRKDFRLSHYQTSAGGEIDLIMKRGRDIYAIEIKSTTYVDATEVRKLARVASALNPKRVFYLSQDPMQGKIENVECMNWRDFLIEFF